MAAPGGYPMGTKMPGTVPQRVVPGPPYQPPTTPEETVREKERITVLLEINLELLKHSTSLQAQGMGGRVGAQQPQIDNSVDQKLASEEYRECMRCLSCNIAYLTSAAAMVRNKPGTLAGPAIMDPPDCLPSLVEPYQKLKGLFPGWKGLAPASGGRFPGMGGMAPAQTYPHGQQAPYTNPMNMNAGQPGTG